MVVGRIYNLKFTIYNQLTISNFQNSKLTKNLKFKIGNYTGGDDGYSR